MKYAISNWIYGNEPIEKTFERLAKFGYDGIEIRGEPEIYNIAKLKELMNSYGIKAASICGMWPWDPSDHMKSNDLANPVSRVREKAIKYAESVLEFGNKLGAPTLICVVGGCGKTKKIHECVVPN